MMKMLELDPKKRITAKEALAHGFLDPKVGESSPTETAIVGAGVTLTS